MKKIVKFVRRKWKQIKRSFKLIKLKFEGNKYKRWYGSEYGGFLFLRKY